jgi:hypothetical protein
VAGGEADAEDGLCGVQGEGEDVRGERERANCVEHGGRCGEILGEVTGRVRCWQGGLSGQLHIIEGYGYLQ